MSLFKSREWWSATCGVNEQNFDRGCVCIANIDNREDGVDKIIVGSHSGTISVFSPLVNTQSSNEANSPNHNSLLLESHLALPVLQLAAGKFVSSSDNIYLAVLHPRKLTVYGITYVLGSVDHGSHYQMTVIYEHNLERSAFAMTCGPFGRVIGRDFLCVMSLDGAISMFEQESYTFTRFLPEALLPGPFTYNSKTDSFIISSSAYQIENYKYQALALSSSAKPESNQRLVMDWSFNLGESSLDISAIVLKNGASLIYVLGERHIYCLKDNGALKFIKKLEFHPSCFYVYLHGDDDSVFYMIASHTGMVMIYNDFSLKWATQVPVIPVYINKINLRGLHGGVLLLSEDGYLSCFYLGTNPTAYSSIPNTCRPLNLEETNKELEKLNRIINAAQKSGTLTTNKPDVQLTITVTVHKKELPSITNFDSYPESPHFSLQIQLKAISSLQNVQLSCCFEKSFKMSKCNFYFPVIVDSTSLTIDIGVCEGFIPSNLTGYITAIYNSSLGFPVIAQAVVILPLKVAVAVCSPPKDADYKLTVCLNKTSVKLDELFSDFVNISESGSGQVIAFQYYGGPIVTILMAKTSQRYRLQSDNFECMGLILSELLLRLQKWFKSSNKEAPLICSYQNDVPLQEYFLVVSSHLQNRQRADAHTKRLSQLAGQVRAIQKRLLLKFKDKAVTPLSNLDCLLESTFKQMSTAAQTMESHKIILQRSLSSAIAASRLICLLLKLYTNMADVEFDLLSKVMCTYIDDEFEQGWEEVVCAGLETLLRTVFYRNNSEEANVELKLKTLEDLDYFKQKLNEVFVFITRGNLIEETEDQINEQQLEEKSNAGDTESESRLIGTQFGERILINYPRGQKETEKHEDSNLKTNNADSEEHTVKTFVKANPEIIEPLEKLPEIYTTAGEVPDFLDEF